MFDSPYILCHFYHDCSGLLQGTSCLYLRCKFKSSAKQEYCIKLNKFIIAALTVFFLPVVCSGVSCADNTTPECSRLAEKASGAMLKYSLEAEVNGPLFFSAIGCGISYRNTELCAMEMVGFDTTAHVYDYYTAEKVKITEAYFCLDEKNRDASILAFSSPGAAAQYGAAKENGEILDYDGLTDRMLK